ncbi:MAG: isochorismatase family cysteine hydrolase [Betaproteobacteria bacterium]
MNLLDGLRVEGTALLVIDMQRDFLDPRGYAAKARLNIAPLQGVIPAVRWLLDAARAAEPMIVHAREGHLPDLSDCPPLKLARSRNAGAEIGSTGALGRLLIRGEPGHDFIDELRPAAAEMVIDKPGYSAFARTDLDQRLRVRDIDTLLLCGIATEVCVNSTLRDAVDRGYRCITVGDACASAFPDLHDAALRMITVEGGIFGTVSSSQQVAAELAGGLVA